MLRDMLHRRVGDLRGQQQQLAIARAPVMRPRLLILDEPTEGIRPPMTQGPRPGDRRLCDGGGIAIALVQRLFELA